MRHVAVSAVLISGLVLTPGGTSAAADPKGPYPVPWTFAASVLAGARYGPDVPPPGSNLPCHPSAAHPHPVVLVHGLAADQNDNWQTMAPFLADNGYCVFSLTYGNRSGGPPGTNRIGGLSPMEDSAVVLAHFVESVLQQTGSSRVDIVGHSEGGTMPDWYLKFDGGFRRVAHFVSISGVLHGTDAWGLSDLHDAGRPYGYSQQFDGWMSTYCSSCSEFYPTASFIRSLDAAGATGAAPSCIYDGASVNGVVYTSIATDNDELVRPPTSDFLDERCGNTRNILVQDQCPGDQSDHASMAADPVVAQDILNALDPRHARALQCAVVPPAVG